MASEQVALQLGARGSLTAFRYSDYDVPFWARPNSRPGRWHDVGDQPTQYWSLTPDGAWAELIRAKDLYTEAELDLVRMPVWVCRVSKQGLVDLLDADAQESCAITPLQMISDDWGPCQQAARSLRRHCRGIISPNPGLDGHSNLTLFGARRAIDWQATPALASALPAAIAAIGRPREGMIPRVRLRTGAGPQALLF